MSQTPPLPSQSPVQVVMNPQPTNTLGLAGFITSLVGVVSCGLLSPVGLLLSLIGLFKEPRGFAIAGSIIGAIGSLFMAFIGLGIVLGLLGIGAAASAVGDMVKTMETANQAAQAIQQSTSADGTPPSDSEGNTIVASYTDAWKTPLRYERQGDSFRLISAGRDQQFDTDDDLTFDENELMTAPSSTQPEAM